MEKVEPSKNWTSTLAERKVQCTLCIVYLYCLRKYTTKVRAKLINLGEKMALPPLILKQKPRNFRNFRQNKLSLVEIGLISIKIQIQIQIQILRFWDFVILRLIDFEILRFIDFELVSLCDFEIYKFWDFDILRFWDFKILRFWDL